MLPSMAIESAPPQEADSTDLHTLAVDIQTDLQKLATGLAHAGAAPPAVATLTHMAEIVAQVVKVLGGAPPSPDQGPPPGAPPQAAPPAQSPPPGAAPAAPHAALGAAVSALHEGMQAAAARRAQGQ